MRKDRSLLAAIRGLKACSPDQAEDRVHAAQLREVSVSDREQLLQVSSLRGSRQGLIELLLTQKQLQTDALSLSGLILSLRDFNLRLLRSSRSFI